MSNVRLTVLSEVADEVRLGLELAEQFMRHVGPLLRGYGVDHGGCL